MNLESPPMLEHLLLESPWAVMGLLAIIAFVLAMAGRRKRSRPIALSALAALILSAGVFVLARAVVTDREHLIASTHALVGATAPLDNTSLDRLIDPTATVSGPDGTVWLNFEQISPRLKSVVGRFDVKSQRVRDVQAVSREGGWGESTLIVRTEASGANGVPINTGWHLTWRLGEAGAPVTDPESAETGSWRVVDIRWMRFNGQEVSRGMMP